MLALQLAAQIAGGPDLLEVGELPTGPVIYLPAEDPPTAIHHRLHALGAHLSAEVDYRIVIATVDDGRRWVLRIPRRAEVSAKVEPEARVLAMLKNRLHP